MARYPEINQFRFLCIDHSRGAERWRASRHTNAERRGLILMEALGKEKKSLSKREGALVRDETHTPLLVLAILKGSVIFFFFFCTNTRT